MKLRVLLCLIGVLVISTGANAGNTWPFPRNRYGTEDGVGNTVVQKPLFKGFYEGQPAWFIKIPGATGICLDLDYRYRYPILASAIGSGAPIVYRVLNYNQGPVFSTRPGESDYSGIWEVVYITWKEGVTRRPIVSAMDLPSPTEADYESTGIVVDRPIIAIGELFEAYYSENDGTYFLPQILQLFKNPPAVYLPAWYVWAQVKTTKTVMLGIVLIPDVGDADMAALLQANYAPALNDVDPANVQNMWAQDWRVAPPPTLYQFPVFDEIDYLASPQTGQTMHNYDYGPVKDLTLYMRATVPPYSILQTPDFVQMLLSSTALQPTGAPVRINAPMVYAGRFGRN